MLSIADILNSRKRTLFSFEVLPPVQGKSIDSVLDTCEKLLPFRPAFIEVTNHRKDFFYKPQTSETFIRVEERYRLDTLPVAKAIKERFQLPVVPHLICSGNSEQDLEEELRQFSALGINNLLVLRGDKGFFDNCFIPKANGFSHASELCSFVNRHAGFSYGVAGYPEKHEEAMSFLTDMDYLKQKVDLGASYIVTQMFFDNSKYFDFVDRCLKNNINIPIVPGLKPLTVMNNLSMIPRNFHLDFPDALASQLRSCKENADVRQIGIEWCIRQCEELRAANVPSLHFFTMNSSKATVEIMSALS